MRNTDIETVQSVLSCSETTARHYLSIFDNDLQRAVRDVLIYGNKPDWWGHPQKNSQRGKRSEEEETEREMIANANTNDRRGHRGQQDGESVATNLNDTSSSPSDSIPSWEDILDAPGSVNSSIGAEDILTDREFYNLYSDLVDGFVDAICHNARKNALRILVSEADKRIVLCPLRNCPLRKLRESDLINRLSYKHNTRDGRSPLSYAVAKNLKQQVYNLIELGVDIEKTMPAFEEEISDRPRHTALTIAATNSKRDGTEMVRILLSKGAKPSELDLASIEERDLGRGMRYWISKSRRLGVPSREDLQHFSKLPPMDRIHEMDYAVVGQESAASIIQEALAGRFGNPQGNRKPLVMLLLGPPGHGKTYFSSNAARSLVGEENFLFVPCQSIRDDADLFGSRLGGSRGGDYSSDGQLTSWLRERQGKKCIVFLDEFEKMKDLTSSLGWNQAKKIYQSFLEPWNDGSLSDQSAMSGGYSRSNNAASSSAGGKKIDCSQSIWILTSNWGQNEIIDFSETHKGRVHKHIDQKDVAWIQKNLVAKTLRPLCERNFRNIDADLVPLSRRIDVIVPFLPFTVSERKVVVDIALTERLSLYREPCVVSGPEEKRRSVGNLFLRSSRAFAKYVANFYQPMQGASGMLACVQHVDGKFQMMSLRNQLGLTDDQRRRIMSNRVPSNAIVEPTFWIHYDKVVEAISITQSQPVDDDDDGDDTISDNDDGDESESIVECENNPRDPNRTERKSRDGAADDAF